MKSSRTLQAAYDALKDLSFPVLFFGVVLFLGMLIVRVVIVPARFPVHMGDSVIRVGDLTKEEANLTKTQADLLAERDKLLALAPTPTLHRVITQRDQLLTAQLSKGFDAINAAQESFNSGEHPALDITSVDFTSPVITLTGTVSDPSGNSIQVLAHLVDSLRGNAVFSRVSEPEYESVRQEDGSTKSPFVIRLTLRKSPHAS